MKNRILPIVAFVIALGIYFGYVAPAWSGSIAQEHASIAADNQALAAAQQYSARQSQLAAARDAIDPANISKLTELLPDSVDNVGLILDLNALAARSGLTVSSINVAPENVNGTSKTTNATAGALPSGVQSAVGTVDLSLSAAGTFASFQSFLEGVERSLRVLDVRDINVKGSDTGVYTYSMTIRLYWLR